MLEMNYGCGSTLDPRDLRPGATVLYVGVGGGLEALQFAYFTRRPGGVLAVDPVAEMRERARANLLEAARLNPWFRPEFVTLLDGSALELPVRDGRASVVAQNCLFNVFTHADLALALRETVRVLRPGGHFTTSDPITPVPLPESLAANERLRARCIAGCQTLEAYLRALTEAGFGRIEVRGRYPYRYLDPCDHAELSTPLMLETIDAAAWKVPGGPDGPAVFTGRTATFTGREAELDWAGHQLRRGVPTGVSEAAAARLSGRSDIVLTGPTYHCRGSGCC
jgi:ubiquinone/menaquinone biosynthesis C-methylase UbiE